MGTSTYDFEGTTGAVPGTLDSGFGTFSYASTPAGTSADASIETTVAHGGSKSLKAKPGCENANHNITTSIPNTFYFRGYFYMTAAPAFGFAFASAFDSGFTAGTRLTVQPNRSLMVNVTDSGFNSFASGTGTRASSSSSVVPLNEWFRLEGKITPNSGEIRLWKTTGGSGVDALGTADVTTSTTGSTLSTPYAQATVGAAGWNGGFVPIVSNSQAIYMDDFAVADAGWIGPTVSASTKRGIGIVRY